MTKAKSAELVAIERLCVQQEMTNRLIALWMMTAYPPMFPATDVAGALSETGATPADIARVVPGITARSVATTKWGRKSPRKGKDDQRDLECEDEGSQVQRPVRNDDRTSEGRDRSSEESIGGSQEKPRLQTPVR